MGTEILFVSGRDSGRVGETGLDIITRHSKFCTSGPQLFSGSVPDDSVLLLLPYINIRGAHIPFQSLLQGPCAHLSPIHMHPILQHSEH